MQKLKKTISGLTLDEERALYNTKDAVIENCIFAGPADGESALKECRDITVNDCRFSLRYPLWHTVGFELNNSTMDELTRAAIWYAENGKIKDCTLDGIKVLRECSNISLDGVTAHSPELGWRCRDISIKNSSIDSQYFLFESQNIDIDSLKMTGKYSFQYTENVTVGNSVFDTKDAFWHCKNVTVTDSVLKGEYLAWYSDGLTLINCKISGTQPLCYCKNLKLINCTTEDTDLAFEYSDVEARINGGIVSVKNPRSGKIIADSIGEIIIGDAVFENDCEIVTLQQK